MTTPPIRIVDLSAADVPPTWHQQPLSPVAQSAPALVAFDPAAVLVVVRATGGSQSPLTNQLHAGGYRPLDEEPSVLWRPKAAHHAAAA